MIQTGTISDKKESEQNAFEEALEEVNGTTTKNITEMGNDTDIEVTTPAISKTHSILFWIIFFLIVVLITIKGVIDLTEVMKLEGQFMEKQYTSSDITELTSIVNEKIAKQNNTLHTAYGMDIVLSPDYSVYTSADGTYALVLYTATFANKTYILAGNTLNNYCDGLMSLINERNARIADGKYKWDTNYIPDDTSNVPSIDTPNDTPITSDTDEEEIVIERGDYSDTIGEE